MLARQTVLVALAILTLGGVGCATVASDSPKADAGGLRPTPFEAWAAKSGTGSFFGAVGPGGGSGVRFAWPE
jgi:hypothetical protein